MAALIDYTGRVVDVTVGAVNVTSNLLSVSMTSPGYEPKQRATWSGVLDLDLSRETDLAAYDMFTNPQIWRPGQAQVRITVDGELLPIMRIERYAADFQQLSATATLVQAIDLVRGEEPELPEIPCEDINKTPHVDSFADSTNEFFAGTYSTPLREVCERLVAKEFEGTPLAGAVTTDFSLFNDTLHLCDRPTQYVDGIAQADEFVGCVFGAMTMDNTESVVMVDMDPASKTVLFSRPRSAVEIELDLDNIDFWSPRAYLEGELFTPEGASSTFIFQERENDELDNLVPDGRFFFQKTTEQRTHDEIFEVEEGQASDEIFDAERKTIFYQYVDRDWETDGAANASAKLIFLSEAVQAELEPFPNEEANETLYQTVTIKEWPKRRIDPENDAFEKNVFAAAEVIVEGPTVKAVLKPKLVLDPDQPTDFTLQIASKETLTTRAPAILEPEVIIDEGGQRYIAQSRIALAPRLPLPDVPLGKTEVIATYDLPAETPAWTPFTTKPLYVRFGFVPSQAEADRVIQLIAERELARRDSVRLTMPIPIEWLQAGCPIAPLANIYDTQYQLDAITLTMNQNEAVFTCSGLRQSTLSAAVPDSGSAVFIPTGVNG